MLKLNLDDLTDTGIKGDWAFLNDDTLIAIKYGPDSFKDMIIIPIADQVLPGKPHWAWNGNREAPTLTPSILVHAYEGWSTGWHGYLTDGKLIDA